MRTTSRGVLGGMRAAELALVAILVAVIAGAALLLLRPGSLETVLGLPPGVSSTAGQGGPGPVRSPDRR